MVLFNLSMSAESGMESGKTKRQEQEKGPRMTRRGVLLGLASGFVLHNVLPAMAETIKDLREELISIRNSLEHVRDIEGLVAKSGGFAKELKEETREDLAAKKARVGAIRQHIQELNVSPVGESEIQQLSKETGFSPDEVRAYTSPTYELNLCDTVEGSVDQLLTSLDSKN